LSWVCMKGPSGVSRVAVPNWPSFDSRNCLQTSFFHISHDFCSKSQARAWWQLNGWVDILRGHVTNG
jgi:hypothetical protein